LGYRAEQMIQRDLSSLTLLDPAKAVEAAQMLQINSLNSVLLKLVDDPSLIDVETFEVAVRDSINITIQSIRLAGFTGFLGTQSAVDVVKYLEEFVGKKENVTALATVLRQVVIDQKISGVEIARLPGFTSEQLKTALNKTYIPPELKTTVNGFLAKTQGAGVFGSIAGAGTIAAFAYKISSGAWGPNSTTLDRWGAARDIVSFLSGTGEVAKAGGSFVDYISGSKLDAKGTGAAWAALGLNETLPEVWGKKSFLPNQWDYSELWKSYDKTPGVPAPAHGSFPVLTATQRQAAADGAAGLTSIWAAHNPTPRRTLGARIGITALKVFAAGLDTILGVWDITTGAIGLKKAIREDDTVDIVANSLQIGGGVAFTVAGLLGAATLFGGLAAGVGVAIAPLFLAGLVLYAGAFLTTVIAAEVKQGKLLQKSSEDQSQWFRDLAKDGLAYADSGNKLEYYHYAWTIYGNDNTNASNQSYLEFQRAEWEHFRDKPMRDGTSLGRLNENLHVHTDLTLEPPPSGKDVAAPYVGNPIFGR
jgi:hypothetical protein